MICILFAVLDPEDKIILGVLAITGLIAIGGLLLILKRIEKENPEKIRWR